MDKPSATAGGPARAPERRRFYRLCQGVLRPLFRLCFGYERHGLERVPEDGPVLLAANHASFLDPPLVGTAVRRPTCFMARASLFKPPLFGRLIRALNAFPLARGGDPRAALRVAGELLEEGRVVLVFPEGTRTRDGRLGRFKRGAGALAVRHGAPVLPIYIKGSFWAWPRHRRLPRCRRIALHAGTVIRPAAVGAQRAARKAEEERIQAEIHHQLRALEAAHGPPPREAEDAPTGPGEAAEAGSDGVQ
jgi:1-acyl-sn-glycerol-3-phosphate acyltransferase